MQSCSDVKAVGGPGTSVEDRPVHSYAGVVVYTGDIMTMPGLPKLPAAESIDIDEKGEIVGLF